MVDASAEAAAFDDTPDAYARGVGWAVNSHVHLARRPNAAFVRGPDERVWLVLTRSVGTSEQVLARYRVD